MKNKDSHTKELLRRWLDGSITAREEAELDRAAQDDPWLAEALEGYRSTPEADHQEAVQDLRKRLEPGAKRRTLVPPMFLRVAAALLLVLVAAWWVWNEPLQRAEKSGALATDTAPVPKTESRESTITITDGANAEPGAASTQNQVLPEHEETYMAQAEPAPQPTERNRVKRDAIPPVATADAPLSPKEPTSAISEEIARSETPNDPKVETYSARELRMEDSGVTPAASPPVSAAAAVVLTEAEEMPAEDSLNPSWKDFPIQRPQTLDPAMTSNMGRIEARPGYYLVDGVVIDEEGYPLIGANIVDMGSNRGVITGVDGRFQMVVDTTTRQLQVSYTGFGTEVVAVSPQVQELEVVLDEAGTLSEVVVIGYGSQPKQNIEAAEAITVSPSGGHRAFRRYVRQNTPKGTSEGKVRLGFKVQADGSVSDIVVLETPSDQLGQLAKALLVEGPKWMIESGQAPVEVEYEVNFR